MSRYRIISISNTKILGHLQTQNKTMTLTPSQQLFGLALLRISPVFLAAVSGTFSYISHEFVAAFKHRAVSFEARQAVLPGWWDHIRPVSLPVIWLSFIPNFFLGLANARSSTLWGWLGDGSVGAVGPLAANLYTIAAIVSIAYFLRTLGLCQQNSHRKQTRADVQAHAM